MDRLPQSNKKNIVISSSFDKCPHHPQKKITFLNVGKNSNQSESRLKCFMCAESLGMKSLLEIDSDIGCSNTSSIFQKWPVNDPNLVGRIEECVKCCQERSNINYEKQIGEFYKDLERKLYEIIQTKKQEDIQRALEQQQSLNGFLNEYNFLSKKQELVELIAQQSNLTLDERQLKANKLVETVLEDEANIKAKLEQLIERYQPDINMDFPNRIAEDILALVNEIDFFSGPGKKVKNIQMKHQLEHKTHQQKEKDSPRDALKMFGKEAQKLLEVYFASSKTLDVFDLEVRCSGINNQGAKMIASCLEQCNNLLEIRIDIGNNEKINSSGVKAIAECFPKSNNLISLDFQFYEISIDTEGMSFIGDNIAKCTKLASLIIQSSTNKVNDDGFLYFLENISKCTVLKTLYLYFYKNNISDTGALFLIKTFPKMVSLKGFHISLENNPNISQKVKNQVKDNLYNLQFASQKSIDF